MNTLPQQGVLRVVPNAVLDETQAEEDRKYAEQSQALDDTVIDNLAAHVRNEFEIFSNHRDETDKGWNDRLLKALRAFNGQYDPTKLAEIKAFGGSDVYARLIAMKCRGASSLLRDIYLGSEKPWGIKGAEDPDIAEHIIDKIKMLVMSEVQAVVELGGQEVDPGQIQERVTQLMGAAREAERKKGEVRAQLAEDKIEELFVEGSFYEALAEFLTDLPLFPFAVLKGPVVKILPDVKYVEGLPKIEQLPKLMWQRISPFDVWWTPGVSDLGQAAFIERHRLTRAEINDLLDLPGYNHDNVRAVLDDYGRGGLVDEWESTDTEQAVEESRENPRLNRSGMITAFEYHGNVQGRLLREYGMPEKDVPDELRDYAVQIFLIGRHVIKVQFSPFPRKRHPYYVTSFEKVPGTPVGNALPDILSDVQDVTNATLRALVNNLSIASGPQVVLNDDRLSEGEAADDLFPWKRWHVRNDPMGNNSQEPVSFFQPVSNVNDLLTTYKEFNTIADELSAIPKYQTGSGASGGAGRTASGLAMLMNNASKLLQTVAANIDRDVLRPLLLNLYDFLMLTDEEGILQGDEEIRVLGVSVAVQRETQRARQLEFLQITANPIDAQIVGPRGRAAVLRSVASDIGLPGEEIVPSEATLQQMEQAQAQQRAQEADPNDPRQPDSEAGGQAQGDQPSQTQRKDMGPRTKLAGGP